MFVDALPEFLASPAQRVDCYIPRKKGGLTSRPFLLYNSTAPELKKLLGRKAGETLELETKLRLMIPESARAESRPIFWIPKPPGCLQGRRGDAKHSRKTTMGHPG